MGHQGKPQQGEGVQQPLARQSRVGSHSLESAPVRSVASSPRGGAAGEQLRRVYATNGQENGRKHALVSAGKTRAAPAPASLHEQPRGATTSHGPGMFTKPVGAPAVDRRLQRCSSDTAASQGWGAPVDASIPRAGSAHGCSTKPAQAGSGVVRASSVSAPIASSAPAHPGKSKVQSQRGSAAISSSLPAQTRPSKRAQRCEQQGRPEGVEMAPPPPAPEVTDSDAEETDSESIPMAYPVAPAHAAAQSLTLRHSRSLEDSSRETESRPVQAGSTHSTDDSSSGAAEHAGVPPGVGLQKAEDPAVPGMRAWEKGETGQRVLGAESVAGILEPGSVALFGERQLERRVTWADECGGPLGRSRTVGIVRTRTVRRRRSQDGGSGTGSPEGADAPSLQRRAYTVKRRQGVVVRGEAHVRRSTGAPRAPTAPSATTCSGTDNNEPLLAKSKSPAHQPGGTPVVASQKGREKGSHPGVPKARPRASGGAEEPSRTRSMGQHKGSARLRAEHSVVTLRRTGGSS